MRQSDIIVTNPPFSLFREFTAQLFSMGKKFLVIGSDNAITYKEFFPYIRANKVWKGVTHPREFVQPDGSVKKFGNISWFTNLEHKNRNEFIPLTEKYSPDKYPKFDNYDAINVDRTKDIPCNYEGVMGVPISFLDKYNPEQFEIVAFRKGSDGKDLVFTRGGENEFNRIFASLSDSTVRIDYRGKAYALPGQKEQICENSGQVSEPIDAILPSATTTLGVIKSNDGWIGNRLAYARVLIRKRRA